MSARRGPTRHEIDWTTVAQTSVTIQGRSYRLQRASLTVVDLASGEELATGAFVSDEADCLVVKLTPGAETYRAAREYHRRPFSASELIAGAIVAVVGGHPSRDARGAGTTLSAVWSHHLAVVGGEDPRQIAETYAPTETKRIAGEIQHLAVVGVEVTTEESD